MGVLVLGMHRSGTSALTRVVSLLGFDVGRPEDLVEATDANPAGHWEVETLSLFNEDLLIELGGKWSGPPGVGAGAVAALAAESWGAKGAELFGAALGDRPWVWKDPRLCLLLPFWRSVLDEPTAAVLVLRHPLEVARSLQTRNDLPLAYGLALWERYLRRTIEDVRGLPTVVVDYERSLRDPRHTWDELDQFFGAVALDRLPAAPYEQAQEFLDPMLRRERRDGIDVSLTPEQEALHEHLLGLVGTHPDGLSAGAPRETPGLQLAFDEHTRMAEFENVALRQRAGIEELLEQAERYLGDNRTLQQWLDESRAETAHAWSEVRRLEAENRDVAETQALVMDYLEQVVAERDRLRAVVDPLRRFPPTQLALRMVRRLPGR